MRGPGLQRPWGHVGAAVPGFSNCEGAEALQRAWGLQRLRLGASDCEGAWGCSWGCSDCGSSWGGSEAAATAAARLGLQLASVVAASSCRRRLVAVVASSPRRYPSPPLALSSPVSSPVVAAPSSRRRVIPPRLYPHRQPVRAPCRSSLCGRRVVVAVARKTIFSKYHYEFTCHVLHPKSTALFTPPFTALVAASISGSRD